MILLSSLFLACLIAFPQKSPVRKNPVACYLAATFVSLLLIVSVWSGWTQRLSPLAAQVSGILTQGGLSGALFILVMTAGAVGNGSPYMKAVMPIRGELSILASILSLGHNIAFGRKYFLLLFTSASEMRFNILLAALCSLVMIAVMIPLFVTSFKTVRRHIPPRRWKRLQRWAYLFYALMPIHVLLLNYPSALEHKPTAVLNVFLYSTLFLLYAVFRIRKALRRRKKSRFLTVLIAIGGLVLWVGILFPLIRTAAAPQTLREDSSETMVVQTYSDGQYTASAIGYNGKLKLSVTISNGKITDLTLLSSVDDEPYLTKATDGVFGAVLQSHSPAVDSVNGATTTSDALREAISNALAEAAETSLSSDAESVSPARMTN